MRCPDCGFDNIGGNYCANCGGPITPVTPVVPGLPPSRPSKPGSKIGLKLAAVVVVTLMVMAFTATSNQTPGVSEDPQRTYQHYFEGYLAKNYTQMADCTILHFDPINRSAYLNSTNYSTPTSPDDTVSITSIVSMPQDAVPSCIREDVFNATQAMTSELRVGIQGTAFLKVSIKWTFGDGQVIEDTKFHLMVLIDGNWYLSSYLTDENRWDNNNSINDVVYPTGDIGEGGSGAYTPIGSFIYATHDSTDWIFYLGTPGETVLFSDCQLQLEIGDVKSVPVTIPSSLHMVISIPSWPATGYDVAIGDLDHNGEITHWETIVVGPFSQNIGLDAAQPPGTNVTLNLIYTVSGGTMASYTFTV